MTRLVLLLANMLDQAKKEVGKFQALEALKNSDGGILLISALKKDISSAIEELANYKTLTHIEMVSIAARISERVSILKSLLRSPRNKKLAIETLEEELKKDRDEDAL